MEPCTAECPAWASSAARVFSSLPSLPTVEVFLGVNPRFSTWNLKKAVRKSDVTTDHDPAVGFHVTISYNCYRKCQCQKKCRLRQLRWWLNDVKKWHVDRATLEPWAWNSHGNWVIAQDSANPILVDWMGTSILVNQPWSNIHQPLTKIHQLVRPWLSSDKKFITII